MNDVERLPARRQRIGSDPYQTGLGREVSCVECVRQALDDGRSRSAMQGDRFRKGDECAVGQERCGSRMARYGWSRDGGGSDKGDEADEQCTDSRSKPTRTVAWSVERAECTESVTGFESQLPSSREKQTSQTAANSKLQKKWSRNAAFVANQSNERESERVVTVLWAYEQDQP